MSDASDAESAARELDWFLRKLRGFEAVAKILREFGSLSNAVNEKLARGADAEKIEADVRQRIVAAEAELSAAKDAVADAVRSGDQILIVAEACAAEIVAEAKEQAAATIATAEHEKSEMELRVRAFADAIATLPK